MLGNGCTNKSTGFLSSKVINFKPYLHAGKPCRDKHKVCSVLKKFLSGTRRVFVTYKEIRSRSRRVMQRDGAMYADRILLLLEIKYSTDRQRMLWENSYCLHLNAH